MRPSFKVGDTVRVIQSNGRLGPTRYKVEDLGERGYCLISEIRKDGKKAANQIFDQSLIALCYPSPGHVNRQAPAD